MNKTISLSCRCGQLISLTFGEGRPNLIVVRVTCDACGHTAVYGRKDNDKGVSDGNNINTIAASLRTV